MQMPKMLTETEVAEILGISVKTLRNWRCSGSRDLIYMKCGHFVRYKLSDVEKFIEENMVKVNSH